jgi:hypothetical protein
MPRMWNMWLMATERWEETELTIDLAELSRVDVGEHGTVITFLDGTMVTVRESPEELLRQAQKILAILRDEVKPD